MKSLVLAALALPLAAPAFAAPTAPAPRAPLREYDILRAFPPGRLAALSAGDVPDAKGLTGSNRAHGSWVESGPQRGSCRAVISAVVAGDPQFATACPAVFGCGMPYESREGVPAYDVTQAKAMLKPSVSRGTAGAHRSAITGLGGVGCFENEPGGGAGGAPRSGDRSGCSRETGCG